MYFFPLVCILFYRFMFHLGYPEVTFSIQQFCGGGIPNDIFYFLQIISRHVNNVYLFIHLFWFFFFFVDFPLLPHQWSIRELIVLKNNVKTLCQKINGSVMVRGLCRLILKQL